MPKSQRVGSGTVYSFASDLAFARRADGVALYSASSGRGTVIAGLYADLLGRALEGVGTQAFSIRELIGLAGAAGDETHWAQLVENLVARGLLQSSPQETPSGLRRIVIAAHGLASQLLSLALESQPLGCEASVALVDEIKPAVESADVLVHVDDGLDTGAFRFANGQCVEAGIRYLPVRLGAWTVEVGPLVIPGVTACFDCLWWRQELEFGRTSTESEESCRTLAGARLVGGTQASVAALAVATVVAELGRVTGPGPSLPETLGRLLTVRLDRMEVRRAPVLRLPDCPACGPR